MTGAIRSLTQLHYRIGRRIWKKEKDPWYFGVFLS